MVLTHAVAVAELFRPLTVPEHLRLPAGRHAEVTSTYEMMLLLSAARLQGMVGFTRQHGQHVEYENDDWLNAMYFEV